VAAGNNAEAAVVAATGTRHTARVIVGSDGIRSICRRYVTKNQDTPTRFVVPLFYPFLRVEKGAFQSPAMCVCVRPSRSLSQLLW